jgi:hypothetical protein
MKKLISLSLTIVFAMSLSVFAAPSSASVAATHQVVPTSKRVSKKSYRKGRFVTVTTWRRGKKVTKKIWVRGNRTGRKTVRKVKHVMIGEPDRRP